MMNRPVSQIRCGNRIIQQKQDTLSLEKHYQSLRKARPMTGNTIEKNNVTINNKKRQMVMQNRFTQIERQNRILFQKITSIMHKGQVTQTINPTERSTSVMNKTLNGVYRKKQLQNIEYENAKMLKRLKEKKSSYGVQQLHKDWIKKKKVIQNMSLYPFILNDNAGNEMKRTRQNEMNITRDNFVTEKSKQFQKFKQIRRIRKIDGFMFLVTVKFESNKLFIIGDIRQQQSIKVIELGKNEAEQFITQECNGKIENIFSMLRYDYNSGDLFLVGKDVAEQVNVRQCDVDRRKIMSQHQTRQKRTLTNGIRNGPPRPMSKQLSRRHKINSSYRENNQQDLPGISNELMVNKGLINEYKMSSDILNRSSSKENNNEQKNVIDQQQVNNLLSIKRQQQQKWVKIIKKENEQNEQIDEINNNQKYNQLAINNQPNPIKTNNLSNQNIQHLQQENNYSSSNTQQHNYQDQQKYNENQEQNNNKQRNQQINNNFSNLNVNDKQIRNQSQIRNQHDDSQIKNQDTGKSLQQQQDDINHHHQVIIKTQNVQQYMENQENNLHKQQEIKEIEQIEHIAY